MPQDETLLALLAGIIAEPDEDAPRLAYADRLIETDPGYRLSDYRAWFIHWQITGADRGNNDLFAGCPYNLGWFVDKQHLWGADRLSEIIYDMSGNSDSAHPKYGCYSWNSFPDRSIWTQTGDVELTYRRGFVHEIKCTAAAFVRNADALVWHPTQTVGCERCSGDGKAHGADRSFEWSADVMYGKCVKCGGNGRGAPRPCPPMAQPIRKVHLTTNPDMQSNSEGWRIRGPSVMDGPFLPRVKTKTPMNGDWRDALPELFVAYWRGIKFTLPPTGTEVASGDQEWDENDPSQAIQ